MKSRILIGVLFSLGLLIAMMSAVKGLSISSVTHLFNTDTRVSQSICQSPVIRMMPLGDSITHGAGIAGGYRIGLWAEFVEHDWQVDFVGSQANGPADIDRDHEGHPGKPIQYLQQAIAGWLQTSQPHIILLMIGTNNVLYPAVHDFASATARLSALIYFMTERSPATDILVASIPPLRDPAANERAIIFNSAIPSIVTAYADQGKRVHYVDMYGALTLEDLMDGIHPNATGYEKLAQVWYNALFRLIEQRC